MLLLVALQHQACPSRALQALQALQGTFNPSSLPKKYPVNARKGARLLPSPASATGAYSIVFLEAVRSTAEGERSAVQNRRRCIIGIISDSSGWLDGLFGGLILAESHFIGSEHVGAETL